MEHEVDTAPARNTIQAAGPRRRRQARNAHSKRRMHRRRRRRNQGGQSRVRRLDSISSTPTTRWSSVPLRRSTTYDAVACPPPDRRQQGNNHDGHHNNNDDHERGSADDDDGTIARSDGRQANIATENGQVHHLFHFICLPGALEASTRRWRIITTNSISPRHGHSHHNNRKHSTARQTPQSYQSTRPQRPFTDWCSHHYHHSRQRHKFYTTYTKARRPAQRHSPAWPDSASMRQRRQTLYDVSPNRKRAALNDNTRRIRCGTI